MCGYCYIYILRADRSSIFYCELPRSAGLHFSNFKHGETRIICSFWQNKCSSDFVAGAGEVPVYASCTDVACSTVQSVSGYGELPGRCKTNQAGSYLSTTCEAEFTTSNAPGEFVVTRFSNSQDANKNICKGNDCCTPNSKAGISNVVNKFYMPGATGCYPDKGYKFSCSNGMVTLSLHETSDCTGAFSKSLNGTCVIIPSQDGSSNTAFKCEPISKPKASSEIAQFKSISQFFIYLIICQILMTLFA